MHHYLDLSSIQENGPWHLNNTSSKQNYPSYFSVILSASLHSSTRVSNKATFKNSPNLRLAEYLKLIACKTTTIQYYLSKTKDTFIRFIPMKWFRLCIHRQHLDLKFNIILHWCNFRYISTKYYNTSLESCKAFWVCIWIQFSVAGR